MHKITLTDVFGVPLWCWPKILQRNQKKKTEFSVKNNIEEKKQWHRKENIILPLFIYVELLFIV